MNYEKIIKYLEDNFKEFEDCNLEEKIICIDGKFLSEIYMLLKREKEEKEILIKKYNVEVMDKAMIMANSLTSNIEAIEEFVGFLKSSIFTRPLDELTAKFLQIKYGIKKDCDLQKLKLQYVELLGLGKIIF